MILTDLPYGTIKGLNLDGWNNETTKWDNAIPPNKIFEIANRILRQNGKMILFSQEPYSTKLINNSTTDIVFNYRMIWEKNDFGNPLTAKKAPVSYYEDILVFSKKYDTGNLNPLREYFKDVITFIGLNLSQINKKLNHRKAEHTFYTKSTQFHLCTNEVYNELIEVFKIDKMKNFKDYEELKEINKKYESIFNLWEGKKHKSNIFKYPIEYNKRFHPTQKPILLLEDLIKTFSNENDLIVDLTMGSGSTILASKNLNRKAIGIELDDEYFEIAKERVFDESKLF